MKEEISKVSHKSKVVGEVTVIVYETVDELLANEAPDRILAMFNKQNKIRIQANERSKHSESKGGKSKRKEIAYNLLTTQEITQYAGKWDALQDFLVSPEMSARVDEELGITGADEPEDTEE